MAHTYIITSATVNFNYTTIVGSVDAIPVTVNIPTDLVATAQASGLAALKNLAATYMTPVAFPPAPVIVVSPLPTGTFTQ